MESWRFAARNTCQQAAHPAARARDADDAPEPATVLKLSEENARVLFLLLKQQIAEFDKKKAKSRF